MSAFAPHMRSESSDITYITPEPFEPKPLIADILRTRFCIPDSIFLIEGVDVAHTSKSKRWRAIRLLLGDGELCIQALLSADMHRFVDRGEITFGSYVKLQRFSLESRDIGSPESVSPREKDSSVDSTKENGQMVYLIVESLVVVGWNNTLTDSPMDAKPEASPDGDGAGSQVQGARQTPPRSTELEQSHQQFTTQPEGDLGLVDVDDDFEVMAVSGDKAAHNREEVAAEITNHGWNTATSSNDLPF